MKSLESSYIYSMLNKTGGLTKNISGLLTNGKTLTKAEVEESIMIISKNFKFPFKFKVLKAFEEGIIVLKYDKNSKLPSCLPFILTRRGDGEIIGVVDVSIYGTFDEDNNNLSIDPKKLYCMMESAYISRICFLNNKSLSTRQALLKYGSNIYSNMFVRVLNKKYSLNLDKTRLHNALFLSSKFFLYNMVGLENEEIIFNYSIKNCPNGNLYSLSDLNEKTSIHDFENFDTFMSLITSKKVGLKLKGLNTRDYIEAYIHMYYESTLLSLESFPYFLYNVISVTNGAYINNQYTLDTIIDDMGGKIYNDIINLDK